MNNARAHSEIDLTRTKREIRQCLERWRGAEYVSIGDFRDQADADTAIVVFDYNGQRVRVEYKARCHHRCNMRAIYLTLEDIRLTYARGFGDIMAHTVAQMLALPGAQYVDPYELLGVRPDAPLDLIEAAWKHQLKQWHPDTHHDDSEEATRRTQQLNDAIERIRRDKAAAE